MKLAAIFGLLLLACAQGAGFRDAKSGMLFPEACGDWKRGRTESHPDGKIGTSAAYSVRGGGTVTVRLFDGHFGGPKNEPSSVQREIVAVAAGIEAIWSGKGARIEVATPVQPLDSDPEQFVIAHRIVFRTEQLSSITLLRYWNARYLCFRFTTPGKEVTTAFNELGRFLAALAAVNPPPSKPATVPQS